MKCFHVLVAIVWGSTPNKRPRLSIDEVANRLRANTEISAQSVSSETDIPRFGIAEGILPMGSPRNVAGQVDSGCRFERVSDAIRFLFSEDAQNIHRSNRELIPRIRQLVRDGNSATDGSIGVRIVQLKKELPSEIELGDCRNVMSAIRLLFDENPSCMGWKSRDLYPQIRQLLPHCKVSDKNLDSKISRVRNERQGPIRRRHFPKEVDSENKIGLEVNSRAKPVRKPKDPGPSKIKDM